MHLAQRSFFVFDTYPTLFIFTRGFLCACGSRARLPSARQTSARHPARNPPARMRLARRLLFCIYRVPSDLHDDNKSYWGAYQ